uniref:Uncharacterized protein n=1 Tax=Candidatus Kentrum sp. FW TaxID=2126338 RepID=A0A450STH9_9GAMM|nr:MAG: hypothetical protein BECKFW1821B_GA0114236_103323 [Candidatus Kentron sp. FW]
MQAYKFETTVLENGMIQLPEISGFADCQADVFIVIRQPDEQPGITKGQSIARFLDKWTGFLEGGKPGDSKRQYLTEKYK